jgi:hypothetical protein
LVRFILTALLVVIVLAGSVLLFAPQPPSFVMQTSFYLLFTTVIVYVYLNRVANPEHFTRLYLGMIALKLMASLGYAIIMIMWDTAAAPGNVLYFLLIYIVLTALEVGFLYRNKKR